MGNSTGWYDPVCYQFYFCAVGDEEAPQSLIDAGRRFAEEMSECYALWLSLGGRFWDSRGEVIPAEWT